MYQSKNIYIDNCPMILIKVCTENKLKYTNCTSDKLDYLYLLEEFEFGISAGTNVTIGKNLFSVVDEFTERIPSGPTKKLSMTLPIGTNVVQSNGISISITSPINVTLPLEPNILLLTGTKLQQRCAPIKITLCEDTEANIFNPKKYDVELIDAVHDESVSLVKILLERGANVHVDNDLPLKIACVDGDLSMVKFLIEYGANIRVDNDLPLELAAADGCVSVVEILLDHGANIHIDKDKPLRTACDFGHAEVTELLLKRGANVNADNNYPIKIASKHDDDEIVDILLKYGADKKFINKPSVTKKIFRFLGLN